MRKTITVLAGAGLIALAATGCSTVNTAPDQVALHYSGGSFSSQTFKECVNPGVRAVNGPSDKHYYYPQGQRTFKFSTDDGSDSGALTASTKDSQELVVKGTVTFTLNTDCARLRKFHEQIGRKYTAYTEDSGAEPSAGWDRMIGVYIKDVLDRAVDNEALKYGWLELYNSTESKARWEHDVLGAFPALVKSLAGDDYFTINAVVLQKPDIADGLKAQLRGKQEATLRAEAANVDRKTAESWPGGIQAYLAYQQQLAINKAITDGKVRIIPIPQGSGINVTLPAE